MSQREMLPKLQGHFQGVHGTELYYQRWCCEKPKGTLIVTHGLAEHSDCYSRFAGALIPQGWEVIAWDLRGHGRSGGRRGVAISFQDYCDDLSRFCQMWSDQRENVYIFGHSMGGLVSTKFLIDYSPQIQGLVLSSPLFGVSLEVPRLKELAGRALSLISPQITLYNGVHFDELTHDKEIIKEYEKDPYRHQRIGASLYFSMIESLNFVLKNAYKIEYPTLLLQAGDDRIVDTKKGETVFHRFRSTEKKNVVYPNFYHEIFNEVERELVFQDLTQWLESRQQK